MARGGVLSPLSGPDRPTLPRESTCLPAVLALATDHPSDTRQLAFVWG